MICIVAYIYIFFYFYNKLPLKNKEKSHSPRTIFIIGIEIGISFREGARQVTILNYICCYLYFNDEHVSGIVNRTLIRALEISLICVYKILKVIYIF